MLRRQVAKSTIPLPTTEVSMPMFQALQAAFISQLKVENSWYISQQSWLCVEVSCITKCLIALFCQNGADRYHCEECDSSYDLCPTCYHTEAFDPDTGRRSAKQHIEAFGNHHTFILETRQVNI